MWRKLVMNDVAYQKQSEPTQYQLTSASARCTYKLLQNNEPGEVASQAVHVQEGCNTRQCFSLSLCVSVQSVCGCP